MIVHKVNVILIIYTTKRPSCIVIINSHFIKKAFITFHEAAHDKTFSIKINTTNVEF